MEFPYGEWTIFLLALVTWTQRHPACRFYLSLCMAWLVGRTVDSLIIVSITWHLNYARLAVMLVFWWWAWRKSERRLSALLLTLLSLVMIDLFLVNQPGILLHDKWIFAGLCFLIAWLSTATYWGMAAAVTGSVFLNQGLMPILFGGIMNYVDLPDVFLWNFAVLTLAITGLFRELITSKTTNSLMVDKSRLFEVGGLRSEVQISDESAERDPGFEVRSPESSIE